MSATTSFIQKYKDYACILSAYTESLGAKGRNEGHTYYKND